LDSVVVEIAFFNGAIGQLKAIFNWVHRLRHLSYIEVL